MGRNIFPDTPISWVVCPALPQPVSISMIVKLNHRKKVWPRRDSKSSRLHPARQMWPLCSKAVQIQFHFRSPCVQSVHIQRGVYVTFYRGAVVNCTLCPFVGLAHAEQSMLALISARLDLCFFVVCGLFLYFYTMFLNWAYSVGADLFSCHVFVRLWTAVAWLL